MFLKQSIYYVFSVLPACMPTHQKRASDPITEGGEPPFGCWELNSGPLEEQSVLFLTSLWHCVVLFCFVLFLRQGFSVYPWLSLNSFYSQGALELTEIHLPLPLSAETKGDHHLPFYNTRSFNPRAGKMEGTGIPGACWPAGLANQWASGSQRLCLKI